MTNVHLLIPSLFWVKPSQLDINYQISLPALETLLTKSTRTQKQSEGIEAWLCHSFGIVKQQNWPIAPLHLLVEKNNPAVIQKNDYWLRADPVHLRIEQNHILLADSQKFQISVKESRELADIVSQQFKREKIAFLPIHANRWYIRLKKVPNIKFFSLDQIAGTNINNFLPSGDDSITWHNIFNEIQMLLHEHPINLERQKRDELAINSLWFWGGGVMPQSVTTSYSQIWSNNILSHALAIASKTTHTAVPDNAKIWLNTAKQGNNLIILDSLSKETKYNNTLGWVETLKDLETSWFGPLLTALKNRQLVQLTLTAIEKNSMMNFIVTQRDLWKFWKKNKPFSSYKFH